MLFCYSNSKKQLLATYFSHHKTLKYNFSFTEIIIKTDVLHKGPVTFIASNINAMVVYQTNGAKNVQRRCYETAFISFYRVSKKSEVKHQLQSGKTNSLIICCYEKRMMSTDKSSDILFSEFGHRTIWRPSLMFFQLLSRSKNVFVSSSPEKIIVFVDISSDENQNFINPESGRIAWGFLYICFAQNRQTKEHADKMI